MEGRFLFFEILFLITIFSIVTGIHGSSNNTQHQPGNGSSITQKIQEESGLKDLHDHQEGDDESYHHQSEPYTD
jgi:hypothetical protein